jgi:hypothetical protein
VRRFLRRRGDFFVGAAFEDGGGLVGGDGGVRGVDYGAGGVFEKGHGGD